ncbi:hypothetical protein D3C72_969140 [compost metagenome]
MPLPSAVTWPIGLPLPSVRVTVLFGSAVPLSSLPLLGLITGAAGATPSMMVLAGGPLLPAASTTTALTTVPSGSGLSGVYDQLPLPSAVVWPMGLPLPSVSTTVLPGSAVPLRLEPLLGLICGASGKSGACTVAGGLLLPAGSVTTTVTVSPLVSGGFSGIWNLPSGPTTTLTSVCPSPLLSMPTVAPGSAVPLILLPSGAICSPLAGAGAVVSGGTLPSTPPPPPPPPSLLLAIATPPPMIAAPASNAAPGLSPAMVPSAPVSDSNPARLSWGT